LIFNLLHQGIAFAARFPVAGGADLDGLADGDDGADGPMDAGFVGEVFFETLDGF